jgi:hypothetical protein
MTDEISTQIGTPSNATSNLAVISLVAGVLGVTFFPLLGSIVAVITGPMAKKEIIESGGELSGEGMATAGMVLGWVAIALMVFGLCIGAFIALSLCGLLGLFTQDVVRNLSQIPPLAF